MPERDLDFQPYVAAQQHARDLGFRVVDGQFQIQQDEVRGLIGLHRFQPQFGMRGRGLQHEAEREQKVPRCAHAGRKRFARLPV